MSPTHQKIFTSIGLILGAFFTAVVALLGAKFVYFSYQTGQVSPDLEWPMWIIYLAIPLGSSLMCYRFLQALVNFLRVGYLVDHLHECGEVA